jgi:anaerobic selenocysteine-containing dehydrogenase
MPHTDATAPREVRSFCRICSGICGIIVEIEDDRVVGVRGDRDHPLTHGFTCVKGRSLGRVTHDPSRFLHSQRRQDDGTLAPIAVDVATREIAARLRDIIAAHGPDAVGMYIGTQNYNASLILPFALAWFRALGSNKMFTTATIDQSAKQVRSMRLGNWEAGRQRFEDSDVWMLVGTNPLVSLQGGGLSGFYQHDPLRSLQKAKERGFRLVVVDPRRSETAAWADVHLQSVPGTDALLLAGLLHVVFAEGLVDHDFCDEHANGVAELRAAVASATPDVVAAGTGLSADDVVRAARCFGTARRGMATTGTGPNMAPRANLSEHLVGCLNVVCGRFPRAGDRAANAAVLKPPGRARAQVTAPRWPPAEAFTSRVRGVRHFDGELPSAIFADEILEPGDDRVRALFVSAGNPAAAVPDQAKIVKALSSLELLVTVDPFPTQTARLADYVIAPTLSLERPDYTRPYESSFSEPFAQYTDPVLPRPGEVIEDFEFFLGLASEMGWTLQIGKRVFEPGAPLPTSEDLLSSFAAKARVPLDEVRAFPGGHIFEHLEPALVEPADGTGARFELAPDDVLAEIAEVLAEPRRDTRYPLHLISRRTKESFNTTGANIPLSQEPYNPCMLHPSDLEALGITPGDLVEIESAYGTVTAVAAADETLRPGVVSLAHCYGDLPGGDDDPRRAGASVSRLLSVDHELQPLSLMPRMSAVPVSVTPRERDRS